jgi:hypothetical protein
MRAVDDYIDALSPERQELCSIVREMILENVPGIIEKFSFKLPFYHYFGMFMYLHNNAEGVNVAFCRGKDLLIAFPQLDLKNRSSIATVCVRAKKDITALQVREMIVAAAAWNEEAKRLGISVLQPSKTKKRKK